MQRWLVVVGIVLMAVVGCAPTVGEDLPSFVVQRIELLKVAPKSNPPASIWRHKYKGRVVYYVPPSCCDVPSELYDDDGNLICGPDGGLTGKGDGKCPDFFEQRTEGLRIWHDSRIEWPW